MAEEGGEIVSSDVFEVFDRRSDSLHSDPPPPRFQGAKTFFAVTLALAVLAGMCLGALALIRGLASGTDEVAICSPQELLDQEAAAAWLRDRGGQATGSSEVVVIGTGCTKETVGQPIGANLYLIGTEGLNGAAATLKEHGCAIQLSKATKTGACDVAIDDLDATVTLAPATAADAAGDYLWSIAVVKPAG